MNEPQHLVTSQNKLGETPIWAPEENALYWVDWASGPTCRFELATGKFTTFPVEPSGDGIGAAGGRGLDCHHSEWAVRLGPEGQHL